MLGTIAVGVVLVDGCGAAGRRMGGGELIALHWRVVFGSAENKMDAGHRLAERGQKAVHMHDVGKASAWAKLKELSSRDGAVVRRITWTLSR
jgi:hypothetical protein